MSENTALQVLPQPEQQLMARPSLADLLERFLLAQDIAQSSKATYRRQLRQFMAWLQASGIAPDTLVQEDILAYKQQLLDSGLSARSVSGYLTAVRRLFTWLEAERIYPNVARVKGAKRPKGFAKDVLTQEQLRQVLETINPQQSLERLRDYALFNLLARTGLRTIEAHRACIGDIRQAISPILGPVKVLYVQGKGHDDKDDYVVLTEKALQPLQRYLRARGPQPETAPLFASCSDRSKGQALSTRTISAIVKTALRAAGMDDKKLTAHSLRHTAITLAILGGASLHDAQAMARHKSSTTTEGYFHNLKRLQNAAERLIDF